MFCVLEACGCCVIIGQQLEGEEEPSKNYELH